MGSKCLALLVLVGIAVGVASVVPHPGPTRLARLRRCRFSKSRSFPLRDEAAMVIVGTALIGLAAAVRRAA
jgi:hypothetical protein